MKKYSTSLRWSEGEFEKLTSMCKASGQTKSQLIRGLIQTGQPVQVVDRSREMLPHLCTMLTIISKTDTDEAEAIRREVNQICQLLRK